MDTNPVVLLFLALGLIILAARLGGALARRLHQPRVLGELIVGVLLGPTVLNMLHSPLLGLADVHLDETIHALAQLGVLLLMFNVGLEVNLKDLTRVGRTAGMSALGGAGSTVLLAVPLVIIFGYSWQPGLFAGVALAATSVSISAQVLLELGVLRTRVGSGLLATALVDDVIALLLVSLVAAITGSKATVDPGQLALIVVRIAGYLAIAGSVAWFLLPRLMNWIETRPELAQSYGIPAVALVLALGFGWSAERFGDVAAISGAFIAGLGLSRTNDGVRHQIETAVNNLAYAFLVPVFFVSVGLQTDLRGFPLNAVPLAAGLLVVAVAAKVLGGGLGAYRSGFTREESIQLGTCLISRGEVSLIALSLAVTNGVIQPGDPLFLALFLVIILTAVLTPVLVRRAFQTASESSARNV